MKLKSLFRNLWRKNPVQPGNEAVVPTRKRAQEIEDVIREILKDVTSNSQSIHYPEEKRDSVRDLLASCLEDLTKMPVADAPTEKLDARLMEVTKKLRSAIADGDEEAVRHAFDALDNGIEFRGIYLASNHDNNLRESEYEEIEGRLGKYVTMLELYETIQENKKEIVKFETLAAGCENRKKDLKNKIEEYKKEYGAIHEMAEAAAVAKPEDASTKKELVGYNRLTDALKKENEDLDFYWTRIFDLEDNNKVNREQITAVWFSIVNNQNVNKINRIVGDVETIQREMLEKKDHLAALKNKMAHNTHITMSSLSNFTDGELKEIADSARKIREADEMEREVMLRHQRANKEREEKESAEKERIRAQDISRSLEPTEKVNLEEKEVAVGA